MPEKIPDEISKKIFLIRGHRVMLDVDLANLYGVTTGNLNKAVRRNQFRFPEDFMFKLTEVEAENLIFQIGISSYKGEKHGGTRHLPLVFTEQGVAMLSSVLKSERAALVNMDNFIYLRNRVNLRQGLKYRFINQTLFVVSRIAIQPMSRVNI